MSSRNIKILITGGCGFLGSNLACYGIQNDFDITVVDNFYRDGSRVNLEWLRSIGKFNFYECDIVDYDSLYQVFKKANPDFVFHLAGQTAMTTSLNDPILDFQINVIGTLNVLECIRLVDHECKSIFASSNKIYGDLNYMTIIEKEKRYEAIDFLDGLPETIKIDFSTPYGCSKGSADQYFLDYSNSYDLDLTVFRHSTMYGSRQFATSDQGWIGFFCEQFSKKPKNPIDIYGIGKQTRDILFSDDVVQLYYKAIDKFAVLKGEAFNIGGGPGNSISLLELFDILKEKTGNEIQYRTNTMRKSDQKVYISKINKISNAIEWFPKISLDAGLDLMLEWVKDKG